MTGVPTQTFSVRQVSEMLEMSPRQVRGFVTDGVLVPRRGPRGKYQFSFQDLVTLRSVAGLIRDGVPAVRVRAAISSLNDQLTDGRELGEVSFEVSGQTIVVSIDNELWEPETGQTVLNLEDDTSDVAILQVPVDMAPGERSAGDWYVYADAVEASDPLAAEQAYRNAIDLDPSLAEAHLNLGRLLHAAGTVRDALEQYVAALEIDPSDATAHYNIGVASQDLGELSAAIDAYEQAIMLAPRFADARYNLASLYEQQGEDALAVQQLKQYRDLVDGR
ncbi:MAG: tetratricopeptide repeat protein [Acidimicrobiia bacterium]